MPNRFKIQAADLCVDVISQCSFSQIWLRDYIMPEDSPADFSIVVRPEDIEYEKNIYFKCCESEGIKPECLQDEFFDFSAIFRLISEKLPCFNGFAFHGSTISVDGVAYIFAAKSGVGKSTHTALWRQYFGERAIMVNDDKPFLRIQNGLLYAYGSQWNGKHNLSTKGGKPVKAICLLSRSTQNHISEISLSQACGMLMQQSLRPRESESLIKLMQLLNDLDKYVKFYSMGCNTDISAAKMAYEFMNKS